MISGLMLEVINWSSCICSVKQEIPVHSSYKHPDENKVHRNPNFYQLPCELLRCNNTEELEYQKNDHTYKVLNHKRMPDQLNNNDLTLITHMSKRHGTIVI